MRAGSGGQLHIWCKEMLWCNGAVQMKVNMNYWCKHLMSTASILGIVWFAALINDRYPNKCIHFFIQKRGILFNILCTADTKTTSSKPQTKFLHSNPAFHLKMASPKKQPFTFVVQFHILKDRLQQSHLSRMAKAIFRIPFWTDTHFPFKQIALFSSLKLHQQDYRIKN